MKLSMEVSGVHQKPIEKFDNIENFEKEIIMIIEKQTERNKERELTNKAIQKFKRILSRFIEDNWFRQSQFKQHSMLSISTNELHNRFEELKN